MLYISFLILVTLVTGPFATDNITNVFPFAAANISQNSSIENSTVSKEYNTDDQFPSTTENNFENSTTENSSLSEKYKLIIEFSTTIENISENSIPEISTSSEESELNSTYSITTGNISENFTLENSTSSEEDELSTEILTTTENISENSTQENSTYSEESTSSNDEISSTANVSDIYNLINSTLSEKFTTVEEIASTTEEISGNSTRPPSDYSFKSTQTIYIILTIVNGVFLVCVVAILVGAYIYFRKLLKLKPDEYEYVENQGRNTNPDMRLGDHQRVERGEDIELRFSDRRVAGSISRSRYSEEFHGSFDGKNRMTRDMFQTSKDEEGEEDRIHRTPVENRDRSEVFQTRDERPHRSFSKSLESQPKEKRRVTSALYRNRAYEEE